MADPMHQFVIEPIMPLNMAGFDVSFTNSSLWMLIGVVLSILILGISAMRKGMVPNRMQMIGESMYGFVDRLIVDNIGGGAKHYFPLVFTVFMIVLMGNILGMIPMSFTYTSHLAVTGALALMIFATVIIMGIARHGLHFFRLFLPAGVPVWLIWLIIPIEIMSFISRPITLSVRLFANMVAGHVLLKVIAGFAVAFAAAGGIAWAATLAPVLFNVIMIGFEIFISLIQAYVFAVLTCIYLKDTIEIDH